MAGVSAAVTAARAGASVILVERFGMLGGNATSGGVGNFSGDTKGRGRFFDECLAKLEALGAIAPYVKGKERVFNHHYLEIILQETGKVFAAVLEDAGVYKNTAEGRDGFLRFVEKVNA